MNKTGRWGGITGLLAGGALFACSVAQAAPITGDWIGGFTDTTNTTGPLTHGSLNLDILTETPDGANFDITAVLNTFCIPAAVDCGSQNVSFSGILAANLGLTLHNGDSSTVATGTVAPDYAHMGGVFRSYDSSGALVISGNWGAQPAGNVPEPSTTSLLGLGLGVAGIALMGRRRTQ
jgi:hypothetical protein